MSAWKIPKTISKGKQEKPPGANEWFQEGHRVLGNIQKSIVFLYTNREHGCTIIKNAMPFTVTQKWDN